jgi:hypothetical protein
MWSGVAQSKQNHSHIMSKGWENWKGPGILWEEPNKPSIFLFNDGSEYWKDDDPSQPSEAVIAQNRLMDEVIHVIKKRELLPSTVPLLREGIQTHDRDLAWNHIGWTMTLSHHFEELGQLLVEMMAHRKASVRLRVIQCMHALPSPNVSNEIYLKGLNDVSKHVRKFAISHIFELELTHLYPFIIDRQKVEPIAEIALQIKKLIEIHTVGYCVDIDQNNPSKCFIRTKEYGFFMSTAEATPEGIRARLSRQASNS